MLHRLRGPTAADSCRPHAANEVYVTGTFDNWEKKEKLEKVDAGHFEKVVQLSKVDEKILYKVCDSARLRFIALLLLPTHWPFLHPLLHLKPFLGCVSTFCT